MIPEESPEPSFSEYPTPASRHNQNKFTRFFRINQGQNFPSALIFGKRGGNI
jgi:hypothetical protein